MKNLILHCIDLTTLSIDDTKERVTNLCRIGLDKHVAAICVYPSLVSTAKMALKDTNLHVASVAGGFPAAQTPIEIKIAEVEYAINNGADEIDMVLSLGKLFEGDDETVLNEINLIKKACNGHLLKCILETGALKTPQMIEKASKLAIEGGADFIKTSTGKITPAATIDAATVMVNVIKSHYTQTGHTIGFKAAGGISTYETAIEYVKLVSDTLGEQWLTPKLFRIGASRLVNSL